MKGLFSAMLTIAYHDSDSELAGRLQRDLHKAHVEPEKPLLLVLVSPDSVTDSSVQEAIGQAQRGKHAIVAVQVKATPLPIGLGDVPLVNFTGGYHLDALLAEIMQTVPMKYAVRTGRLNASNRTAILVITILAVAMFVLSLLLIGGGMIGFPNEEYNAVDTEAAVTRDAQIRPTLALIEPRTTDDAANFAPTVEALSTFVRPFARMTATAIAEE